MRIVQPTTHLKLPRVRFDLPLPASITIVVFCLITIVAVIGRIRSEAPAAPAIPTPAIAQPIVVIQKEPAAAPAQPVINQPAMPRMVVAFAAPNGDVLGPIEAPDLGALVARWGDQWLATMHDGAMVWIRVSELGGSLANVAPAAPQIQPVYQPAPAPAYEPQPQYQTDNAPPPAPEQPADQPQQAQPVAAPVPQAQPAQPAATPSLQEALDRTAASTAANPNGGEGWKLEHCMGSGDQEVCH